MQVKVWSVHNLNYPKIISRYVHCGSVQEPYEFLHNLKILCAQLSVDVFLKPRALRPIGVKPTGSLAIILPGFP